MLDYIKKLNLPREEKEEYLSKLIVFLRYRPKLRMRFEQLQEEGKLPLTITEEMLKNDPYYQKGVKEGIKKGIKEGIEKGIKEGIMEAKKEDILNLYNKLKLDPEKISEVLEIPIDIVKQVINSHNENK